MLKMYKNKLRDLAAYLLAALLVTACNQEEHAVDTTPVAARFWAGMDEGSQEVTTQSRASGTTWNAKDSIGIFMVDNGTSNLLPDVWNVKYWTEDGNGTFSVAQGSEDIYFPVDETRKVDFLAYYPYQRYNSDGIYPVDVFTQKDQAAIDLLYTNSYRTNTAGYDKTDPQVDLVFSHQLSRLILNTTPGLGLDDLSGLTVEIHGINTTAYFDLYTGELSNYSGFLYCHMKMITDGKRFEAILLPDATTSTGEWYIEFKLGEDTYTWYVPAGTVFEAGAEHTWTISVQQVPIQVSARIEAWTQGTGGSGIAN